jgi:hypothetical protein
MKSRRSSKGQFSMIPGDVWVEVDGGRCLGNKNEFPPDPARPLEKPIIDEVNFLRNDVSQLAASGGGHALFRRYVGESVEYRGAGKRKGRLCDISRRGRNERLSVELERGVTKKADSHLRSQVDDSRNSFRNSIMNRERVARELLVVARSLLAGLALPVESGDTILIGRFKNRKAIVKGFGLGKLNQPVIFTDKGEMPLFKFRIPKLIGKADVAS